MSQTIEPHRVTKPIQLLAAWLVGLVLTDSTLLAGARVIDHPPWASGLLVIAAVVAIPAFLLSIFLLQTKFRPEMQEDVFYSEYLKNRMTGAEVSVGTDVAALRREMARADRAILDTVRKAQAEMTDVLRTVTTASFGAEQRTDKAIEAAVEARASELAASIGAAAEELSTGHVGVSVNVQLPMTREIQDGLTSAGLVITEIFGQNKEKPVLFVLTATTDVPVESFRKALRVVADLGLEAVSVTDELGFGTRIYVGSYGYEFQPVAELTSELRAFILDESHSAEVVYGEIRRNAKVGPFES